MSAKIYYLKKQGNFHLHRVRVKGEEKKKEYEKLGFEIYKQVEVGKNA